ncbi:hypothetical protein ACOME3_004318 [Neoechinorhynchus agilis]
MSSPTNETDHCTPQPVAATAANEGDDNCSGDTSSRIPRQQQPTTMFPPFIQQQPLSGTTAPPPPPPLPFTSVHHQTSQNTDGCMSVVHTLMQGGESESFAKRAIESLVKKLKDKRDELDALLTAITMSGAHMTKCVTIQRTLDGRLQVAGRKGFPHVIYARLWRWPDLHKNELKHLKFCQFAFDLKQELVCVNPYHYERVISTIGLCVPSNSAVSTSATNTTGSVSIATPVRPPPIFNGVAVGRQQNIPPPPHPVFSSPPGNTTPAAPHFVEYATSGAAMIHDAGRFYQQQSTRPPNNQVNTMMANRLLRCLPYSPDQQLQLALQTHGTPEIWCSVSYFELDQQVGQTFKVSSNFNFVIIDGYTDFSSAGNRFCLGALTNVRRTEMSEKARLHIGKGVILEQKVDESEIWVRCQSDHSVFVESLYLDRESGRCPGDAVHKIYPHSYIKVFDLRQFYRHLYNRIRAALTAAANGFPGSNASSYNLHFMSSPVQQSPEYSVTDQVPGNPTPISSEFNRAASFDPTDLGVDHLRRLCILRLSFVKGWGSDYPRKTIEETPSVNYTSTSGANVSSTNGPTSTASMQPPPSDSLGLNGNHRNSFQVSNRSVNLNQQHQPGHTPILMEQ